MTPEERARQFIAVRWGWWAETTESEDVAALALVIRDVENDALERAARLFDDVLGPLGLASDIRALKHVTEKQS